MQYTPRFLVENITLLIVLCKPTNTVGPSTIMITRHPPVDGKIVLQKCTHAANDPEQNVIN
jgi:hypothetical protein